ncbi:hypothetical protein C2845_PM17G05690 [Panicum miliaceum]|uniref:Uncharacterized protein n=1 Tax=Panicum miliaceum TaxID=4540 RepID=A0A3L6Q2V6_PANMI|nr:hypothetical protein C2845_PM17G05690 [Panicum miliaceum]
MDAVLQELMEKDDNEINQRARDWRSKDRGLPEEIQKLKNLVIEQSEREKCYDIHKCFGASPQQMPLDPRAPALFAKARDLVRIDGPRKEIIELLKCGEMQHKVVSIYIWKCWAGEDHSCHRGAPQNYRTI